jgi:hypothetical protein
MRDEAFRSVGSSAPARLTLANPSHHLAKKRWRSCFSLLRCSLVVDENELPNDGLQVKTTE